MHLPSRHRYNAVTKACVFQGLCVLLESAHINQPPSNHSVVSIVLQRHSATPPPPQAVGGPVLAPFTSLEPQGKGLNKPKHGIQQEGAEMEV